MAGTSTTTTHAPSRNLAATTTSTVVPVDSEPGPLISMLALAPRPAFRFQCITMPACESVNAAEQNQETAGEQRQDADASRVHQPPPAICERVGKVAIDGNGP